MPRPLALLAVLLSASLAGCAPAAGDVTQLEAFEASNDQQSDPYEGSEVAGTASVSGADRDWTLAFPGEGEGITTVTVHAPGESDLSGLDAEALTVTLGGAWGSDTRTVAIVDGAGPVFLGQPGKDYGPATDAFGVGFVDFGDEVGTGRMSDDYGEYEVSYRSARFQTDDGEVEALAGEPFEAALDGDSWRIVVHASFEVTKYPDAMPGCGGGTSTTLSFEMLRIADAPRLDRLTPASGRLLAGQSHCG